MAKFCTSCGAPLDEGQKFCTSCGAQVGAAAQAQTTNTQQPYTGGGEQKSKVAAGLLQIFLGGLGIGRFYLGYTGIGVAQLLVTLFTCGVGGIWPFIDGIMILTGSVPTDANGVPLKD